MKPLERKLRETNSHDWSELLEQAGWGIALADSSGEILEQVNPAVARMHGYTTEELAGTSFLDLLTHPFRAQFQDHLQRAMRTSHHNFESINLRKGGATFPVLIDMTFVNMPSGKGVLYCLTDGADAIERKRAEEALRKLSTIVEQTADAVLVTDRNGTIEYVNSSFEKLTGYKMQEAIGKTPALLKSGKHDKTFYANLWNTLLEGRPFVGVLINKKKSGELYYSQKTITPLQSNGVVTHFVSTDKDITETKIAEENLQRHAKELAQSNQDLEQFAHFIAHDLQEPVRMVTSYLQLIRKKMGPLDRETEEYLTFAVDGGKRMQQMIGNMLQYSRAGRESKVMPANCEEVLGEAMENLAVPIREKYALISHGKLPLVKGDRVQLVQLFQNLIGNALKYQDKNTPEVHISAAQKNGEWLFSIRDNGIGISSENTRRIFCLFQRLHGTSEYSGSGIGLAICERIVSRHGGRIWVESQPGLGSTFFFTLPAWDENLLLEK